jgi:hypothetical protein
LLAPVYSDFEPLPFSSAPSARSLAAFACFFFRNEKETSAGHWEARGSLAAFEKGAGHWEARGRRAKRNKIKKQASIGLEVMVMTGLFLINLFDNWNKKQTKKEV